MSVEREKERLEIALNSELEVISFIKEFFNTEGDEFKEFLKFTWNYDMAKKVMKDMSLDISKLPLGCLKIERVKKSLQILYKIQK